MRKILLKGLLFNLDSHRANPVNLFMGVLGMLLNNAIVLWTLWVMLFHGKPQNEAMLPYFLALTSMVAMAWGVVSFFIGGLRMLGSYIDDGTLEPMLATPRHPLLLVAVSRSSATALGDLIQGLVTMIALIWIADPGFALRGLLLTALSCVGVAAVFIIAGSLSFFFSRGNNLGNLLIEISLSLSFYPSGKIFTDRYRLLLYVLPAAGMAILPMEAVELPTWRTLAVAVVAAFGFLGLGLFLFSRGLRHYRSANYVGVRV